MHMCTKDQTIELQVDTPKQAGCTTVYTGVISGARAERPVFNQLLETVRGRSLKHVLEIVRL